MNEHTLNQVFNIRVAVIAPVKETFTYSVPEGLRNVIKPGYRVSVPLGSRIVTGYVLALTEDSGGHKLKNLLKLLDQTPLFHPSIVIFFEWISNYYMYPIGEMIQSVLPGGINVKKQNIPRLTELGSEMLKENRCSAEELKILKWISENSCVSKKPWPHSAFQKLADKNFIYFDSKIFGGTARHLMRNHAKLVENISLKDIFNEKAGCLTAKNEIEFLEKINGNYIKHSDLLQSFSNAKYLISKWTKLGVIKNTLLPVSRDSEKENYFSKRQPEKLSSDQEKALVQIINKLNAAQFSSCLLFGVTGSGKTEVYLRAVEHVLSLNKQAIVMVPEISLASVTVHLFKARFGECVAVYHSGLSDGERYDSWMKILKGDAKIVVGARSALFVPFERLGLIVVDEEYDTAYKQDQPPRYHARDSAIMRAKFANAVIILGSGTPSVQVFEHAFAGKFDLISMPKRIDGRALPEIEIVDMKKEPAKDSMLSERLLQAVGNTITAGDQVILFLNRRGYFRVFICQKCGQSVKCPDCDVAMTFHISDGMLSCHYCGFSCEPFVRCTVCSCTEFKWFGFGTEKLEEDLSTVFKNARISRLDFDSTRRKDSGEQILRRFNERKIDILVGTQMLAKGFDFEGVTLAGVVAADLSLAFPDFRAAERTYQLLSQVAGRAGRGIKPGKVIIQSFHSEHYAIQCAVNHDYETFFNKERQLRKKLNYPPFSYLAAIKIQGLNDNKVKEIAGQIGRWLQSTMDSWPNVAKEMKLMGPVPAPVMRVKRRYRWHLMIKSPSSSLLQNLLISLADMIKKIKREKDISITVDIDPYNMI